MREGGGVVSARIVMAAARGILLSYNKQLLAEYGGPMTLGVPWAYSLLGRMNYVKRKSSTAKSKYTVRDFMQAREIFLNDVVTTVTMEEIPLN